MTTGPDDPVRTYSIEEQSTLTRQLEEITRRVHGGELRDRRLDLTLLRDLHGSLFRGVRDHAGRMRSRGFGQEYLTFGPNRSVHRDHVERELSAIFVRSEAVLRALREHDVDEQYEPEALRLAAWAHAEIVRVHPFEDGNGRTSRLCAAHLLVALGLRPVPMEAVKQEYTAALNAYYAQRDIAPLVDLFVALYPVGR